MAGGVRLWLQLVRSADRRGDIGGALSTILTNPPYGEGVDQAKVGAEGSRELRRTAGSL